MKKLLVTVAVLVLF